MNNLIKKIKESNFYGKTLAVSIIFLVIIKQILLYNTDGTTIIWDIFLLSIVTTLVCINALVNLKIVKIIINIINTLIVLLFILDTAIIYFFKSRLSIFEVSQFAANTNTSFFNIYIIYWIIWFCAFIWIVFYITQRFLSKIIVQKKTKIRILMICLLLTFVLWIATKLSAENTKIQMDIISYNMAFWKENNDFLKDIPIETGKAYKDFFTFQKWAWKKPNIILVFAESFSAIDSKRVWWIYDNMPLFDKIQEQWITYTNFLANGCTSETTHIAILQWVEAWEHPSMTKENEYSEYASINPTLPNFLEKNWYSTLFLSTVTLDFLHQRQFLKNMWFDKIYWDELFTKEKKYTFWAAPDEALYAKGIELSKKQSSPYFLTMQTISSHEPYSSPYGEGEELTLKYADQSIYDFYQNLQKIHFFDNWILIILADHRRIDTATDLEKQKYWISAPSRVLWTVIWKDIPKWIINDTPIQHIDFYYSIKKLIWKNNILTRNKYNDAFTNIQNRDRTIRYCRYYLNDNWYILMKWQNEWYNVNTISWASYIKDYINAYKIYQYNNRQSPTKTEKNYLSGNFTEKLLQEIYPKN